MGSVTRGPFDPTVRTAIDTLLAGSTSGCILIHNLSPYELFVTTPDNDMTSFVAAWGWRRFDATDPLPFVEWMVVATPAQSNPPLSVVFVESYGSRDEAPPQYFGQYQRQTSVGNNVSTTSTPSIKNDGNGPGTLIVESTPNDQASSSFDLNNDGSGSWLILSANVLRTVLSAVRGTSGAVKAVVQVGDSGDVSITTFYGAIGAGSTVPAGTIQAGALPAGVTILPKQIVLDGTAGDETFAGAGDLYIPHGLHIDGSVFGIAGVLTVGDAIKASGGWDASTTFPGAQVTGDIAAAQVGPGALDTDVTILPKQISLDGVQADETFAGAGDLFVPHGIHVAGSVLGTAGVLTVGDAIKAGAGWDASTTFPGAQVTGDIAAAQVGPGALDADVTIAGSQVTGGVAAQGGAFTTSNDVWGFPSENAAGTARWRSTTTFNGTGSGTYNHGFATLAGTQTPNFVAVTSNQANSTQTVGVDSLGSTSVHVNEANAWPFYGFAART